MSEEQRPLPGMMPDKWNWYKSERMAAGLSITPTMDELREMAERLPRRYQRDWGIVIAQDNFRGLHDMLRRREIRLSVGKQYVNQLEIGFLEFFDLQVAWVCAAQIDIGKVRKNVTLYAGGHLELGLDVDQVMADILATALAG